MSSWMRQNEGAAEPPSVRELYPNAYAGGTKYPDPGDGVNASEDGIRCAHCGYPIPNRKRAKTCPNCGSDNFEGQRLAR